MPINSQFLQGPETPNPAMPSAAIAALFPPGVIAAELRTHGDLALLDPLEARSIAKAVPKRVGEFAAGRLCARRALAGLGVTNFALQAAPDRAPVWPESIVGSITHTRGFCAAVAAERRRFAALGLDVEVAGDVKPDLWRHIGVPEEIAWLDSLPPEARAAAATLVFSAKEAFYKCQYPLTGERLGFADVRVSVPNWTPDGPGAPDGSGAPMPGGGEAGSLTISRTKERGLALEPAREPMQAFLGSYRIADGYVSTAFWLVGATAADPAVIDPTIPAPKRARAARD